MIINKIIVVEGLDKTGKTTFCDNFEIVYNEMAGIKNEQLKRFSFPNITTPIGKVIRDELNSSNPNPDIVSTPNFLSEMSHFWMQELYLNLKDNKLSEIKSSKQITKEQTYDKVNYLIDRYFLSTLAYQAFFANSKIDLEFIKTSINNNNFLKYPTDIIFFDLPNEEIIKRTNEDQQNGINDINDTLDPKILDKRRDAYFKAIRFFKNSGINIHWFEDVSLFTTETLTKILFGKIFG